MDDSSLLKVWTAQCESAVVVYASGELDIATSSRLVEAIEKAIRDNRKCVLDCEQVTFIDSEAIKALLTLNMSVRSSGKQLSIGKCSSQVFRTLRLLGLADEFNYAPTLYSEIFHKD